MAFLMILAVVAGLLWAVWLSRRYKGRIMGPEPEPERYEFRVRFEEDEK